MKVVFLDRDGTIIQDPIDERVDNINKIELFPDTITALKMLADHGYNAVIITNQAGIAEGRITEEDFWKIHNEVLNKLAPSGINILATYFNGESGDPDASEWRKPGPKMLLKAAEDLKLDLSQIYMVGDNQSDIDAGINAGCKGSILVETARNKKVQSDNAVFSAQNLLKAFKFITQN
jgi:histidinol-phosphate phosphatase family protein